MESRSAGICGGGTAKVRGNDGEYLVVSPFRPFSTYTVLTHPPLEINPKISKCADPTCSKSSALTVDAFSSLAGNKPVDSFDQIRQANRTIINMLLDQRFRANSLLDAAFICQRLIARLAAFILSYL